MSKRFNVLLCAFFCLLIVISCAKKGSITGGKKDEEPPKFMKAFPPNYVTDFDKKEVKIYFDEYIKLKEAQKQIIISPPMNPKPLISPLGGASKFVKIEFEDTLLQNTTYSVNFGESIVDNNEGNAYPFFRYVFSTGAFLDSLYIKGTVKDAIKKEADPFITVALYEMNTQYSDSIVFNEVPRYVTSTLDSVVFNLGNIKEGKYKLLAFKDASSNYLYDPRKDKIGFYEEIVELPADTAKFFNIRIFKEALKFRAIKPKQQSNNEILFGYEGVFDSMKVKLLSEVPKDFESRVIKDKEKDTLHYWFKPYLEKDSLVFEVTNTNGYRDTLVTRFRKKFEDSLVIKKEGGSDLTLLQDAILSSNIPLAEINTPLILLKDKDTVDVPFKIALDKVKNEAKVVFDKTEDNMYTMELLPGAVKDFIGNVNDSLQYTFRTKKVSDYGKIFLTITNVSQYPLIVQVTKNEGEVISQKTATDDKVIVFEDLDPGKYAIRVIYDQNKNNMWDTGNYLKGIQPERVTYFPDEIDVRANWELKQTFILEDNE